MLAPNYAVIVSNWAIDLKREIFGGGRIQNLGVRRALDSGS